MDATDKVYRTITSCKHPHQLTVCQNWIENLKKTGKIREEDLKFFTTLVEKRIRMFSSHPTTEAYQQ